MPATADNSSWMRRELAAIASGMETIAGVMAPIGAVTFSIGAGAN